MSDTSRTAFAAVALTVLTLVSLPAASLTAAGAAVAPGPADDGVALVSQDDATTTTAGNRSTATTTAGGDTGAENRTESAGAYDGAHVSVGVESAAITDYSVDGRTYFDSIEVQSRTGASDAGVADIGSSLTGLTQLPGAGLSVASRSPAALALRSETGAALSVHDNEHGIVVIRANRGTQYVQMNVSENAEATYEGDSQVIVTTEERDDASVTVVGNGSLGINDEGNAVAELGPEGLLVVRSYEGKRGSDDRKQESFIGDGVATGEVYVMDRSNGTVVDTVSYENETNLTASAGEEGEAVNVTVERSQRQGAVVFTSIDTSLEDPNADVRVTVDGEPAALARTYAQLRSAANNGPESRYKISPSTQGGAAADVAVAINHFSTREVAIRNVGTAGENGTTGTGTGTATATPTTEPGTAETTRTPPENATGTTTASGGTPASSTAPGFGLVAALVGLVALVAAAVAGSRRRR